jgi:hypothetical protein
VKSEEETFLFVRLFVEILVEESSDLVGFSLRLKR